MISSQSLSFSFGILEPDTLAPLSLMSFFVLQI